MNLPTEIQIDSIIENIAKNELGLETLKDCDWGDFTCPSIPNRDLKKALIAAFKAGFKAGKSQ